MGIRGGIDWHLQHESEGWAQREGDLPQDEAGEEVAHKGTHGDLCGAPGMHVSTARRARNCCGQMLVGGMGFRHSPEV